MEGNNDIDDVLMALGVQIRSTYQNARLEAMNNVRNYIRKKNEGISYRTVEKKKEKKTYDKKYADKNLIKLWNEMHEKGIINNKVHDFLENIIVASRTAETLMVNKSEKAIKYLIKSHPVWINFLSKIKGIGNIIGAKLIYHLGTCERFNTVSSLWHYTGYHVENGKAPKKEKGKLLSFNPILRSFIWQISTSFLKLNKGYYRKVYNDEKKKQVEREYDIGELHKKYHEKKDNGKFIYEIDDINISLGHAHNRALRKSVKHFLAHYWECAREVNGLSIEKSYVEGVLKHQHIVSWKDVIKKEDCLVV